MAGLSPDVRIFEDLNALSHAAADAFVAASAESIGQGGRFLVALSGGGTPVPLYTLLAAPLYVGQVRWPATHVFWGDERCVPVEDLENSYRQVHDILLGRVPIPPTNVHRIRSELEPEDAAADYQRTLKEFASPPLEWPRFDLVLLGLGSDGHTASLFPGSEVAPATSVLGHRTLRKPTSPARDPEPGGVQLRPAGDLSHQR
jgi:6-phosphogluconolactonase